MKNTRWSSLMILCAGFLLIVVDMTTLAGTRTLSLVHDGMDAAAALAGGYHFAWLVGAGTVVVTLALTISLLRGRNSAQMDVELTEDEAA